MNNIIILLQVFRITVYTYIVKTILRWFLITMCFIISKNKNKIKNLWNTIADLVRTVKNYTTKFDYNAKP